jgi:hypothetical protein
MSDASHPLEAAYRGTSYYVDTPGGRLCIRVDEPCLDLDHLLMEQGARSWAYITAYNPHSVRFKAELNAARQRELEEAVARAGYRFYRGEGVGSNSRWPPEASLLILDIDAESAARLAGRFCQLAMVVGVVGEPARLVWLTEPNPG